MSPEECVVQPGQEWIYQGSDPATLYQVESVAPLHAHDCWVILIGPTRKEASASAMCAPGLWARLP